MDFTQAKQTVLSELQGVFDTVDEKQSIQIHYCGLIRDGGVFRNPCISGT